MRGKGRPIKHPELTPEEFLEVLERNHCGIYKTCHELDVPYTHYQRFMQDPDFAEAVDALEKDQVNWVEEQLFKKINEGSEKSIQFYLRMNKKARDKYEVSQKIEADVNAAQQIDVEASLNKIAEQTEQEPF